MANTYNKILLAGLQSKYNALETKDPNVLYFCTDTGKIYKGEIDFTSAVTLAASESTVTTPIAGRVYIFADTSAVKAYISGAWKTIALPAATEINESSDDNYVATAKAVYDAIHTALESVATSADSIKSISAAEVAASLTITKGDNTSETVEVKGVVTTPTWDPATRKLTLPVSGGTSVEVNIGKDIFIDATADNKYNPETGNIEIYLNDTNEDTQATKIEIPASALIDVYEGEKSTTADVSVTEDNKIKVDIILDPDTNNALVVGDNGLKVDLSVYAKTEVVNAQISAVQTIAEGAKSTADANKTDIEILKGDVTTEGSVAKAVADAKALLEQADINISARVTALEDASSTTNTNIQANTDNIAALATATTEWGTF